MSDDVLIHPADVNVTDSFKQGFFAGRLLQLYQLRAGEGVQCIQIALCQRRCKGKGAVWIIRQPEGCAIFPHGFFGAALGGHKVGDLFLIFQIPGFQAFEKDMQTAKDSQSYDKDGKLVFSIELDGTTYDKREDAGKALLGLVGAAVRADHPVLVGHYAGFEVTIAYVPLSKVFVAHLVGEVTHTTELGSDAAGNMVRLQNVVAALPQEVSGLRNNLQQLRVQLDSAKEELQQPFLQEQELNDKSARLAELDVLLNVGNDAPVLEGEAEVVNEDDSVRTPREENELER